MTLTIGWFNDWWIQDQKFDESGNDFVARLTAVPYWRADGANYLHLGISSRYVGPDHGKLRLKGRPESNVTWYYVDSGALANAHAKQWSLEGLWGYGPLLVSAEHAQASVAADDAGHPVSRAYLSPSAMC